MDVSATSFSRIERIYGDLATQEEGPVSSELTQLFIQTLIGQREALIEDLCEHPDHRAIWRKIGAFFQTTMGPEKFQHGEDCLGGRSLKIIIEEIQQLGSAESNNRIM